MIQICEGKVKLAKDIAAATPVDEEKNGGEEEQGSISPDADELVQWTVYMANITASLETLEDANMKVQLHDNTNALQNLSDLPKQPASETLTLRATYSLMCYTKGKEPTSLDSMCDVESPLETNQKLAEAAAEAARVAAAEAAAAAQE